MLEECVRIVALFLTNPPNLAWQSVMHGIGSLAQSQYEVVSTQPQPQAPAHQFLVWGVACVSHLRGSVNGCGGGGLLLEGFVPRPLGMELPLRLRAAGLAAIRADQALCLIDRKCTMHDHDAIRVF